MLLKYLMGLGQYWPKYIPFAMYSYDNIYSTNLNGFSPYELVFGRKPKVLIDLETDPSGTVSGMYKEYYK